MAMTVVTYDDFSYQFKVPSNSQTSLIMAKNLTAYGTCFGNESIIQKGARGKTTLPSDIKFFPNQPSFTTVDAIN